MLFRLLYQRWYLRRGKGRHQNLRIRFMENYKNHLMEGKLNLRSKINILPLLYSKCYPPMSTMGK